MIVVLVVRYSMVRPKQQRRSIRLFHVFNFTCPQLFWVSTRALVGDVIHPGVRGRLKVPDTVKNIFNSHSLGATGLLLQPWPA